MTDLLARAYQFLDAQDTAGAIALLRGVDDGEAAGLLADLLSEQGDWSGAVPAYQRALVDDAGRVTWLRGLATGLLELGQRDDALTVCADLLSRRADDGVAHRLMARLLVDRGELEAALSHAREARFLAPHDLSAITDIALVMVAADEGLAAVEMLDSALHRAHPADPALAPAQVALARAWKHLGEPAKAFAALRDALEIDPQDLAGAAPLLAQWQAEGGQTSLPPAFVRALFDTYADRFDRELVSTLRYDAPAALRDLLRGQGVEPGAGLCVLDAGCGTGLAGQAVADMARHLDGFDLSPRMVDKARARDLYHRLWVGDLLEGLARHPCFYDLILAADVLVYVGDLAPVMAAATQGLALGGRLAFTCERIDGERFHLHEGRRFAHGDGHIRRTLADAGLTLQHLAPHSTRIDRGQPVPGWIVLATKG